MSPALYSRARNNRNFSRMAWHSASNSNRSLRENGLLRAPEPAASLSCWARESRGRAAFQAGRSLAQAVWRSAFKNRPSPWVANKQGWSPRELPQFLPIIFELAYRELGEKRFSKLLTESLYAHARFPSDDANFHRSSESLAVIARLLVAEQRRGSKRRITNVVTLNADDLVENAVSRIVGRSSPMAYGGVVRPVARSLHSFLGATHRIVPLYHIHGFLQSARMSRRNARMLVFTDSQYWSTSASAFSFANRIMTSALSEGRCVFVGLSMTDINLLRWFALRTLDRDRESYDGMKYIPREHWDLTTEFGADV